MLTLEGEDAEKFLEWMNRPESPEERAAREKFLAECLEVYLTTEAKRLRATGKP